MEHCERAALVNPTPTGALGLPAKLVDGVVVCDTRPPLGVVVDWGSTCDDRVRPFKDWGSSSSYSKARRVTSVRLASISLRNGMKIN